MKKELLTCNQVTENLMVHFQGMACTEIKAGGMAMYKLKNDAGEIWVTPKRAFARQKGVRYILKDHPSLVMIQEKNYLPVTDKKHATLLQTCCGFITPKKIEDGPKQLWQLIQESNHRCDRGDWKESQFKNIANGYKPWIEYTRNLCENFKNVSVSYAGIVLKWQYYNRVGKKWYEGNGRKVIDGLDVDVLIPELNKILNEYGNKIIDNNPKNICTEVAEIVN